MNKTLFLALFVFVLLSCRQSTTSLSEIATPSVNPEKISSKGIIHWNLSGNKLEKDFFDKMVDSISLIELETRDNFLIGQVNKVFETDNKFIVVDGQKAQTIFAFDRNGKLLYKIGTMGKGKNEYMSINDAYLLGDTLVINDWMKSALFFYSIKGELLGIQEFLNNKPDKVMPLDNSIFVGAYAGYFDFNPYRLKWFDRNDSITGTALPFTNSHPCTSGRLFKSLNGEVLYNYDLNDTIYSIRNNEMAPKITLDLYDSITIDNFSKKCEELSDADYQKRLFSSDKIVSNCNIVEAKDYWMVEHQKYPRVYLSIIDKLTNKSYTFLRSDIKKEVLKIPFIINTSSEDWLISYIDDSFIKLVDKRTRDYFVNKILSPKARYIFLHHDFDKQNPIICKIHINKTALRKH